METQVTATATAAKGSLAAVGAATKAFIVAHPITLAAAGGALVGIGTYRAVSKMTGKKAKTAPAVAQEEAVAA